MSGQTIETTYILNGSAAKQELARLQAAEDKLGASSGRMAQGLSQLERGMLSMQTPSQRLWASLNTVDGKMLSLGEQAKALQQKLGPAAAAISGVSAALGQQAGEAGKAVAAAGQLVAAYGSGGVVGVAVAAATIAVGTLQKAWDDSIAAQDKAIAASTAQVEKSIRSLDGMRTALLEVKRAAGYFADGPNTAATDAVAKAQANLEAARQAAAAAAAAPIDFARAAADAETFTPGTERLVEAVTVGLIPAQDRLLEQVDKEKTLRAANIKVTEKAVDLAERALRIAKEQVRVEAEAKANPAFDSTGKLKPTPTPTTPRVPPAKAPASDGDTLDDWKQRAYERAAAEQKAQEKLAADRYALAISAAEKRTEAENAIELRAAKDKAAALLDLSEKTDAAILRHRRESAAADKAIEADRLALAESVTSSLMSTTQVYFEAKIAGGEKAKYAEAAAAAEALKGIGDQLVGFGVMQEFKALAYAIDSGGFDPRAAGLAATGGAAVAVGLGMGAGAAAINSSIPSSSAGGSGSSARSTAGAGSGSSSSSSSSSTSSAPSSTTINITYGGPTGRVAEDVAKDVEKSQRKNAKRGRR